VLSHQNRRGEAGTIAGVVDSFVWAIETSDFERRLQILEADLLPADGPNGAAPGYPANSIYWRGFALDSR
jgi:hypothetical protein